MLSNRRPNHVNLYTLSCLCCHEIVWLSYCRTQKSAHKFHSKNISIVTVYSHIYTPALGKVFYWLKCFLSISAAPAWSFECLHWRINSISVFTLHSEAFQEEDYSEEEAEEEFSGSDEEHYRQLDPTPPPRPPVCATQNTTVLPSLIKPPYLAKKLWPHLERWPLVRGRIKCI